MSQPESDPIVGRVPSEKVESLNLRIAADCHEWVFARRDNSQVEDIARFVEEEPVPTMEIQGPTPAEWVATARRMQGLEDG